MISQLVKPSLSSASHPQGMPSLGENGFPRKLMLMSIAFVSLVLRRSGQSLIQRAAGVSPFWNIV